MIMSLIAAISQNYVIGKEGKLPWHLPLDLALFKKITTGHHVVMGRGNFMSLNNKPLSNRVNIVISRTISGQKDGFVFLNSISEAINLAMKNNEKELFFIGGESIFKEALGIVNFLYLTFIDAVFEGDRFFPSFDLSEWQVLYELHVPAKDSSYPFRFKIFRRKAYRELT